MLRKLERVAAGEGYAARGLGAHPVRFVLLPKRSPPPNSHGDSHSLPVAGGIWWRREFTSKRLKQITSDERPILCAPTWKISAVPLGLAACSQSCPSRRVNKNEQETGCWRCLFLADHCWEWSNLHIDAQKRSSHPLVHLFWAQELSLLRVTVGSGGQQEWVPAYFMWDGSGIARSGCAPSLCQCSCLEAQGGFWGISGSRASTLFFTNTWVRTALEPCSLCSGSQLPFCLWQWEQTPSLL